jgi:replication initiation protein RepC
MEMEYTPVTSFRRPITAALLKQSSPPDRPTATSVGKWDALRSLAKARRHYDLSDRDLNVLQTLLGFHPEAEIGTGRPPAIVYPSNKAICERLNGMPCSTMRRHIARLVNAGVILRRDSPNGKRYVRRGGGAQVAYGFDLSPLSARHAEFTGVADRIAQVDARRARLRETVSLMRRDLAGFVDYGADILPGLPLWDRMSDLARLTARDLRRKLDIDTLSDLQAALAAALDEVRLCLDTSETDEIGTSDAQIEQHHQNSDKEYTDREKPAASEVAASDVPRHQPPPLRQVLDICKEIQGFSQCTVRHWDDLVRLSDTVSPMMGISATVWKEAQVRMGAAQAATVLAAMLERFADIQSPSAYLRALGQKAARGAFSCAAMIRALDRRQA